MSTPLNETSRYRDTTLGSSLNTDLLHTGDVMQDGLLAPSTRLEVMRRNSQSLPAMLFTFLNLALVTCSAHVAAHSSSCGS